VPVPDSTETGYIRQGVDSHGVGEHLPGSLFQWTSSRDASLSRKKRPDYMRREDRKLATHVCKENI
jgi:hypothetical protein